MRRRVVRRRVVGAVLLVVVLVGSGCGRHSKASTPSIKFTGKVNQRGTVTVRLPSGSTQRTLLQMDMNDYSFTPTVVKVKAGTDLTLQLRNQGSIAHSFTITALHIDLVVLPGQGVNQPMTGFTAGQIHFVCRFHRARGMQGGFLVGA